MKKLRNKTYIFLISILTIFLITILLIFNIGIYSDQNKEIKNRIIKILNVHDRFNPNRGKFKNPMFMDNEVYIVSLDIKGNIIEVNNYTDDGLTEEEIIKLVKRNINKIRLGKVSNLYTSKYIFWINRDNDLIIINNSNVREYLISNILKSIIAFIILELLIIYISNTLTKWIVKPVEESFEKQKQFISDASHELKTPISIILASIEALEDNPKESKWLDNIKSESERMTKLVSDLLDLSRLENSNQKEVFNEIDLSKTIKNKALSFESLMYEQELELTLDIEKEIKFNCNQDRIKELLSILIDNAIKHGYKKSKIEVKLIKNKDKISLYVKNRGDAIPLEEQPKIFDRFYRVDKSRNRDSNRYGLGLAIAKSIVTNHNGTISVECKNGYTTFIVEFKQN